MELTEEERVHRVPCPNDNCRVKPGIHCRWITEQPFHPERVELAELYWELNARSSDTDSARPGGDDAA